MEVAALIAAGVALLVALVALARAGAASARGEEFERDLRRRAENASEEVRREIEVLKKTVAVLAEGGRLSREQVLEGRLWSDVSPDQGRAMVEAGEVRLVDVRTPQETAGGIIPGAKLIPIDELEARMRELPNDGKRTLVYCAGGGRSAAACELLSQHGYANLHNLEGGFGAWSGPRVRP